MDNYSPDILENTLRRHADLLDILLIDRTKTTKSKVHNIIWGTESYAGHMPEDEIKDGEVTGVNSHVIQPRISKSKEEQKRRVKDKAEVFTPRDIVNQMNNQVDWQGKNWPVTADNWQDYVNELKLEITCGEAPFIVGRYNAATGKKVLNVKDRVGFLDRKLQQVSKYCDTKKEFYEWSLEAFKASYGYEWQGDNLLLARENLLYTFIDYWNDKFPADKINLERKVSGDKLEMLREIATVISWNIFQMDGLKYIIPMSDAPIEKDEELPPLLIQLGEKPKKVVERDKGKPAKIMDWEKNKVVAFKDLL